MNFARYSCPLCLQVKPAAASGVLNRKEGMVTANASVVQYAEITPENVAEFHFHGATGDFS